MTRIDSIGRRRYLQLVGGVGAIGVAGCSEPSGEGGGGGTVEEQTTTEGEPQDGPVQDPNETGQQDPGRGPTGGPAEGNQTLERDQEGGASSENESGTE